MKSADKENLNKAARTLADFARKAQTDVMAKMRRINLPAKKKSEPSPREILKSLNSPWFYDNYDFYGYLMVNASYADVQEIISLLTISGLIVDRHGHSKRPAHNSIQYDWFIRITDQDGHKPSAEEVEKALATKKHVEDSETAKDRQNKIQMIVNLEDEIIRLRNVVEQNNQAIQIEIKRFEEVSRKYKKLLSTNRKLREDLKKSEKKLIITNSKTLTIPNLKSVEKGNEQPNRKYLNLINDLKQSILNKDLEINNLHTNLEEIEKVAAIEREEYVSARVGFENDMAMANKVISDLIKQQYPDDMAAIGGSNKPNANSLVRELILVTMPNHRFYRGSLDILEKEINDPARLIKLLLNLPNQKAERFSGTKTWKYMHHEKFWRVYFRHVETNQFDVLISDKEGQKRGDIEWLKQFEKRN